MSSRLRSVRLAPAVACAIAVAAGCESTLPSLALEAIEPDIGSEGAVTRVTLRGRFYAPLATDLRSGEVRLRDGYQGWAGSVPLDRLALVSAEALEAEVPRGLEPGLHDVSVRDPLGRSVVLPGGFRVVPADRVGPTVEILRPSSGTHVAAGSAFVVRFRASERQPARVAAVEWVVLGGGTRDSALALAEPLSVVEGSFVVEVPAFPTRRTITAEVIAWDDAPDPNLGGARVEVMIDCCSQDRDCDDGRRCNGRETCVEGWCAAGEPIDCDDSFECTVDSCDEDLGGCVHVPNDERCDDGLACTGVERCTVELGCVAGRRPCDDGVACTVDYCDEATLHCWVVPSDAACDDGIFCNGAELCDPGLGCRPGAPPCLDGLECTADLCNEGSASCNFVPDHAACNLGDPCQVSRCDPWVGCVTEPGIEGPVGTPSCEDGLDGDCDGLADAADPGCRPPPCLALAVVATGPGAAMVEVELCEPGHEPALILCESSRNEDLVAGWDFESGLVGLDTRGAVRLTPDAQAPLRPGSAGLELCGDGSSVEARLSTVGRRGLGLRLALGGGSLSGDEHLLASLAPAGTGTPYSPVLLAGDGLSRPYRSRVVLLPAEAEGRPDLRVRVEVVGGAGCGHLDDLAVLDLPARSGTDLLVESFDTGFGALLVHDPTGAAVRRVGPAGGSHAELAVGSGAWIAAVLRIPTLPAGDALEVALELGSLSMGPEGYGLVQCSLDRGASWVDLLGTGLGPADAMRLGAIVPAEGGLGEELQLRVLAPTSAVTRGADSLRVDDLAIRAVSPERVDEIGAFADRGDGTYAAELTSRAPGLATIRCGYLTPGHAEWAAPVSVELP